MFYSLSKGASYLSVGNRKSSAVIPMYNETISHQSGGLQKGSDTILTRCRLFFFVSEPISRRRFKEKESPCVMPIMHAVS